MNPQTILDMASEGLPWEGPGLDILVQASLYLDLEHSTAVSPEEWAEYKDGAGSSVARYLASQEVNI